MGRHDEYMTWETITPERAVIYLSHNSKNNRNVRSHVVDRYATDMANGDWDIWTTDNKISFDVNGVLIDGQHRLHAVIKAKTPIKMRVFRNVKCSAKIFDRGAARSSADIITMGGKYGKIRISHVAIARLIYGICNYKSFGAKSYVSDSNIEKMISLYFEDIQDVISATNTGAHGSNHISRKSGCQAAAFFARKSGIDIDFLKGFFATVNSGLPNDSCKTCSPAIILRNYIMSENNSRDTRRSGQFNQRTLFNTTTQAIYDAYNGKDRKIRYSTEKRCFDKVIEAVKNEMDSAI